MRVYRSDIPSRFDNNVSAEKYPLDIARIAQNTGDVGVG